jgi:hypothetical protein
MYSPLRLAVLLATLAALVALPALSADFSVAANDTVETVLAAQQGKRVSLRLRSGQELTGTIKLVTPRLVHLGAIAGRELFDAAVPLEAVEAVLVRAKD